LLRAECFFSVPIWHRFWSPPPLSFMTDSHSLPLTVFSPKSGCPNFPKADSDSPCPANPVPAKVVAHAEQSRSPSFSSLPLTYAPSAQKPRGPPPISSPMPALMRAFVVPENLDLLPPAAKGDLFSFSKLTDRLHLPSGASKLMHWGPPLI